MYIIIAFRNINQHTLQIMKRVEANLQELGYTFYSSHVTESNTTFWIIPPSSIDDNISIFTVEPERDSISIDEYPTEFIQQFNRKLDSMKNSIGNAEYVSLISNETTIMDDEFDLDDDDISNDYSGNDLDEIIQKLENCDGDKQEQLSGIIDVLLELIGSDKIDDLVYDKLNELEEIDDTFNDDIDEYDADDEDNDGST